MDFKADTYIGGMMQKFPLRKRSKRHNGAEIGGFNHNQAAKQYPSPSEMPPRRTQRICRPMSASGIHQSSATRSSMAKVCNRVFPTEPENFATWEEVLSVGSKSKSLSPVSSSPVNSNTAAAAAAVMAATTQEPVQQTSAGPGILEVPCNATAASANISISNNNSNNNANGNRNKDDDDNNCRRSRQQSTSRTAQPPATPAASAREFMTSEGLRLRDQINFLLFDPYRTLKFLITELKSRLRTVVPDDINVQKILVEIQQTMKRIRFLNVTEPPRKTTTITGAAEAPEAPVGIAAAVECILPKERCHVIKEDPLINHAGKVNSSCQTMEPQLENVKACQMCEHEVKQSAAGCNQRRMNGSSCAKDFLMVMNESQRSKDHMTEVEVEKQFSYKTLQDAIENLKIKSNPFSDDAQKIITQLETELLNFQHVLQRRTSLPHQQRPGIKSTTENLKVQCKRLMDEEREKAQQQQEEEETFPHFIANQPSTPSMFSKKLDSSTQVAATTVSKESQTNLKNPTTQMFCHLEKEKLLLLQQFRASEMQNIQGDLTELHVFIKDQLDGIYQSITRKSLNLKYHSNEDRRAYKNKKKIHRTVRGPEKTPTIRLPSSSPSSLTALTSSVLSSTELQREVGVSSSESPGHYKKSSSTTNDGNANNTKSMMKQKHQQQHQQKSSSSSLSAADARDVDRTNKALGEKKSKEHHSHRCSQHHLFAHINCCAPVFADTPFCSGKKIHFSAVECEGCRSPHTGMDDKVLRMMTTDAARTSTHSDIKSTKKTSQAPMTCHQHGQQCHQQTTTMTTTTRTISPAQEQSQLISSSLPVVAGVLSEGIPPYITKQSAADQTPANLEAVTNAAVRTIMENAYASVATAPEPIDCIRMHKHRPQAHNSWQRVNLKNPTACQLKKQICGDGYECRINNNNNNDNRSNYSQIHDCQKCRASIINPFGRLCSVEMHEVGADNVAASAPATPAPAASDDDNDGGDRDAGGDGPIYWNERNGATAAGDFTCHIGQRKQPGKLHSCATKASFQTDFDEFKAFLDEVVFSTPR